MHSSSCCCCFINTLVHLLHVQILSVHHHAPQDCGFLGRSPSLFHSCRLSEWAVVWDNFRWMLELEVYWTQLELWVAVCSGYCTGSSAKLRHHPLLLWKKYIAPLAFWIPMVIHSVRAFLDI
jgi:hypothetical protein